MVERVSCVSGSRTSPMYFSFRRILLMVLVHHFVLPAFRADQLCHQVANVKSHQAVNIKCNEKDKLNANVNVEASFSMAFMGYLLKSVVKPLIFGVGLQSILYTVLLWPLKLAPLRSIAIHLSNVHLAAISSADISFHPAGFFACEYHKFLTNSR